MARVLCAEKTALSHGNRWTKSVLLSKSSLKYHNLGDVLSMTGRMPSDSLLPEMETIPALELHPIELGAPWTQGGAAAGPWPHLCTELRSGLGDGGLVGYNSGPGREPGIGRGSVHGSGNRQVCGSEAES